MPNHERAPLPEYTPREELANSLSHALGLLIGLVAVPWMLLTAVAAGNWSQLIGTGVFGFSFLLVYAASTFYHGMRHPDWKHRLRILDHIAIYVMIAGSYTPFVLMYVYNSVGLTILGILWTLTLVGIVFKLFFTGKFEKLSVAIYVLMGWMLIFAARTFWVSLPATCLLLIVIGGLFYTVGVFFYRWESLRYHHTIWHAFVLAASLFHLAAVWWSVS